MPVMVDPNRRQTLHAIASMQNSSSYGPRRNDSPYYVIIKLNALMAAFRKSARISVKIEYGQACTSAE
jgi:hypothetical protein